MERISSINSSLKANRGSRRISEPNKKSPSDVVIVSALRTPLCRAGKGGLKDTTPEILLSHVLKAVIADSKIDPKYIEDLQCGNVLMPGAGALVMRAAQILANMDIKTPVAAINRQCSSGLEACSIIASKIKSGLIEIGIGAGVESMSLFDMQSMIDPAKLSDDIFDNETASNCLLPMGQCSEILTDKYGLKREKLDEFALNSHKKASFARKNGYFKDEIVPIKVKKTDPKTNATNEVLIENDDGIRDNINIEGLAKLKPVFRPEGMSTAGNSSQTTDGAAAVLLMKRETAEKLGMKILGKFISHAVVGVPPDLMGIGPAEAIPIAVNDAGLKLNDIDIFEINEAFASQCSYCIDVLGIDRQKVNPKGGAIAFGHPLGCTGARMFATLLTELKRTDKKYGIISMCIGTGMGAAAVIERE